MINIVLGTLVLLLCTVYMYWLINQFDGSKNSWGQYMDYKGLVGGFAFIVIGIMLIVKGCNSL